MRCFHASFAFAVLSALVSMTPACAGGEGEVDAVRVVGLRGEAEGERRLVAGLKFLELHQQVLAAADVFAHEAAELERRAGGGGAPHLAVRGDFERAEAERKLVEPPVLARAAHGGGEIADEVLGRAGGDQDVVLNGNADAAPLRRHLVVVGRDVDPRLNRKNHARLEGAALPISEVRADIMNVHP